MMKKKLTPHKFLVGEKRIYYIDVGQISSEGAQEYIRQIQESWRQVGLIVDNFPIL